MKVVGQNTRDETRGSDLKITTSALEHFLQKWTSVFRKNAVQNKNIERLTASIKVKPLQGI